MPPVASTVSSSTELYAPKSADGFQMGQASTDLIAFYGASPIARPAGATAITDASGGTAAATNGVLTLTGTYNSAILANAIATLAQGQNAIRSALVSVGLITG